VTPLYPRNTAGEPLSWLRVAQSTRMFSRMRLPPQFQSLVPKSRRDAVAGFIIGVALLSSLGFVIASIGVIDISADRPHGWFAEHFLHFVFKRSVAFHSDAVSPPKDIAAPSRVKLGAQHYALVCTNCHAAPGIGQSSVALSMQPRPQSLANVIKQFTDPELFWIVKHGVKFSAMPSWPNQVRNDEVWSMVAFLKRLPKMTSEDYRAMTASAAPSDKPIPADGPTALRSADTTRNNGPTQEYLYAVPAIGFSDPHLATDPVQVCARCHDKDGSGNATGGETPNLTIQDAKYLRASLNAFALGARKSGFMQQIAGQLSEDQISRLADYYGGLSVKPSPPAEASPDLANSGKAIALGGISQRAIPACATCHEKAGSEPIAAPNIAGQSLTFLRHELEAMRYGGRGTTGLWNPMSGVAHDLSDSDIEAVAAYYASLPPSKKPPMSTPLTPVNASPSDGEALFAKLCVTCHFKGSNDDAAGGLPNLSIQAADYIAQSLRAYRAGTKSNEQMNNAAHGLEDSQIAALSTYLSGISAQASPVRGDADAAKRGAKLVNDGDASRKIPSCMTCHSKDAVAQLPLIARLQGQNANYLKSRLDYFASTEGAKGETALNPMPAISRQLSDSERADVAAYFSSLSPLAK
jgi:cytochrome c553/cytochrome c5